MSVRFFAAADLGVSTDHAVESSAEGWLCSLPGNEGVVVHGPHAAVPGGVYRVRPRLRTPAGASGAGSWDVYANGVIQASRRLDQTGAVIVRLEDTDNLEFLFMADGGPFELGGVDLEPLLLDREPAGAAEASEQGRPPGDLPRPLIWINLRAHNKIWVDQAEGFANILNALWEEHGSLSAILDGMPDCEGLAEQIRARTRPEVRIFDGLRLKLYDSLNWAFHIDAYIATIGSGLTFLTWIADKPGVAHAERAHLQQLEFWSGVRPGSRPPLAPDKSQIVEVGSGMYCDYQVDWRILLELVRQALASRSPE